MTRTPNITVVLTAVCILAASCAAGPTTDRAPTTAAAPPAVTDLAGDTGGVLVATLENGLTVIVKPSAGGGVVTVRAYVRAGGLYEGQWLGCGVSHLLEHLVAKGAVHDDGPAGAAKRPRQTTSRVAEIGGMSNAYTSLDATCYYISATAGKTDDCIDLIADWLARSEITAEDFEREHGVVQRELEMGSDTPGRQMWYAHAANLFGTHPAAVPVIGYPAPLSKLTRQDVLAYHRRMYVPQNMVFCVVGDVDAAAVLDRTRRAFAGFDRGRSPDLSLPEVSPIAGVRRVVRPNTAVKEVLHRISFLTIPLLHEDLYALDVLSYILSQGRSSRLVRSIERREKLVTSIDTSSWTPSWGRGSFTVAMRSSPDKADAAEAAVLAELGKIVQDDVTADELARAKRQKVADLVYSQQTVESQASTLASDYLSAGDVTFSRNYTKRIQAVSAEDVRRVARKYFKFDQMAITRLVPASRFSPAEAVDQATRHAERIAFKLPNGLRVILSPAAETDLVSMAMVTTGGLLAESEATNGLGAIMTALSTKGAGKLSAEQIAAFFDRAGGSIAGHCGNNTFYWQATVLEDGFDEAMEILADVIQRPTFSKSELDILRPVLLARATQIDEQWNSQLRKFFRAKFFAGSPYRMLPVGRSEVIESATADQVAAFHRETIKAGNSVLAVFGEFDADEAREKIESLFKAMPAGTDDIEPAPAAPIPAGGKTYVLKTSNTVAGIIVATAGMKLDNFEDRFPTDVLDTIISGYRMPGGWLHEELRGRQLVYVVHAYNWMGLAPGAFVTYAATQPENARKVVEAIRRNLDKAAGYEPSQEEIDQAVNIILTAELLDNQAIPGRALAAALDELYYGFDLRSRLEEFYRKVTPEDVLRVGRKYLGGPYVTVVTTPQVEIIEKTDGPQ